MQSDETEDGERGRTFGQRERGLKDREEMEKETEAHVHCLSSHYVQECTSYLCEKVLGCQRRHCAPRQYEITNIKVVQNYCF